jgi:hypothetical protein
MWGCQQDAWRWEGIVNSSTWVLNQAGVRYEALMNEWTTHDANTSDASGQVGFRGFHGTYEITLSAPGQTSELYTIEIEPGTTTEQFELETALVPPAPDYTPPTPDPMTWLVVPTATGPSTITMTATTASDPYGVEYSFDCLTAGGHDSGWTNNPIYQDTGLNPSTQYTYRVHKSPNQNATGWSDELSATTLPPSTDVEIIGSWISGLTHAKEAGTNRALILIAHVEEAGAINLSSVTYGGQSMTKVIDIIVGTNPTAYVAAYILNETGIAAATSDTFTPTWSTTPDNVGYASVFLKNVNQSDSIGASGSNSTATGSPNPIEISAGLVTNDGDMVIEAATCGNAGNYTLNYGFIEGIDQQMSSSTGVTGYKAATGAVEYPSATFNTGPNRQVIIGFVVNAAPSDTAPAAPTGLIATAGNKSIILTWNSNSEPDMNGYNVYRSTTQGGGYAKVNGSLLTSPNYADSNLTNGTPYYYVVTAVDLAGHESTSSSEATATPDYQSCAEALADGHRLPADLAGTGDCYVTFTDFAVLAGHWLDNTCTGPGNCDGADFEPNGSVDIFDLSEFTNEWLTCNDPANPDCPPPTF